MLHISVSFDVPMNSQCFSVLSIHTHYAHVPKVGSFQQITVVVLLWTIHLGTYIHTPDVTN